MAAATWQQRLADLDAILYEDVLTNLVPTLRHIPRAFQGPFREILSTVLGLRAKAAKGGDATTQARVEKALLLLPRCVLRAPPPKDQQDLNWARGCCHSNRVKSAW